MHRRTTIRALRSGLSMFLLSWKPVGTINCRPYSKASTIFWVDSMALHLTSIKCTVVEKNIEPTATFAQPKVKLLMHCHLRHAHS